MRARAFNHGSRGLPLPFWIAVLIAFASMPALTADESVDEQSDESEMDLQEMTCGPAAMAAVMRLHGIPVSNIELAELDDRDGFVSLAQLEQFCERTGLRCAAVRLVPEELMALSDLAVLHLNLHDNGEAIPHFIIVRSQGDETFVVIDPLQVAFPRRVTVVDAHVALRDWTGAALLVSPVQKSLFGGYGMPFMVIMSVLAAYLIGLIVSRMIAQISGRASVGIQG